VTTLRVLEAPRAAQRPTWLRTPAASSERTRAVRAHTAGLPTVCEEARCPNQGTCWSERTATFLLLGDICTRGCRFCSVTHGRPSPPDLDEAGRLVDAAAALELSYVVLTCVDRDDLPDGGAAHLADCVRALKQRGATVELLAGDFGGDPRALDTVIESGVDVFAHNLETVERLTPAVRDPRARYVQSLAVLTRAKDKNPQLLTKSGLLLGLGETDDEVLDALTALRGAQVDIVTLGQYLRPSSRQLPVKRYVEPALFDDFAADARSLGFRAALAGPLVRASYRAAELWRAALSWSPPALA
jgi:lipoyl synthase